jgi:hypothetical protein
VSSDVRIEIQDDEAVLSTMKQIVCLILLGVGHHLAKHAAVSL